MHAIYLLNTYLVESSDVPQNVSVFASSPTVALLKWLPPPDEHHNGIIVSYNVHITGTNSDEEIDLTTHDLQLIVEDLHPFYSYEFSVAAFTIAVGPFSDPVVQQMPEAGNIN